MKLLYIPLSSDRCELSFKIMANEVLSSVANQDTYELALEM